MEVSLEAADLVTVVGASIAAGIITQFARMLFTLSTRATRIVCLMSALAVVLAVTITSGDPTAVTLLLAVLVGMQAGLAAWAAIDVAKEGLDYQASSRS